MNRMRILVAILAAIIAPAMIASAGATPATCGAHGNRDTMIVSTAWLAEHWHDANVVVLTVGQKSDYDKGHIPGSISTNYHETHLMEAPNGLSVELLPPDQFAGRCRRHPLCDLVPRDRRRLLRHQPLRIEDLRRFLDLQHQRTPAVVDV